MSRNEAFKEAVARYIDAFARVYECLKKNWDIERISQVTALSRGLTKQYVDLIQSEEIVFEKVRSQDDRTRLGRTPFRNTP